ncbi:MAG: hypothetical protein AB7Y46_06605 [Armatimonadota bacterium]
MRHRRLLGAALVAAMAVLVVAAGADAQMRNEVKIYGGADEKPVTLARQMPEQFDIGVGGLNFFRIRANAAGFTAAERARIVDARLVHILSYGPLDPDAVSIVPVRGKPTIYVGKIRLVTVYPSDVEAAGADSMQQLAYWWAASVACCLRDVAPWQRVQGQM